jgi:LmbE family N-acetylglucosaminyl deacetylase
VAELVERAPASALAVYAHPDDPEVGCGGTLARWANAGADVHVVICTAGDKGAVDASVDPARLVTVRAAEVERACAALGVAGHTLLGHPDGEIDQVSLRRQVVALVRRRRPEVVLCPDPTAVYFGQHYFNHRDHRAVGWATMDALAPDARSPLYEPEAGPPHRVEVVYLSGALEPDVWVDIGISVEAKTAALACHASQLTDAEALSAVVRARAEEGGRSAGVRYAEGFRRVIRP